MRLRTLVPLLAVLALPRVLVAQSCLGWPLDAGALIGARAIVASGWRGGGARAAIPSNRLLAAVEADLLHNENGADGRIATLLIGTEGGAAWRICSFATGSLFSSEFAWSYTEYDAATDHIIVIDTLTRFSGRAGSIGVGIARWVYGSRVDVLVHAAGEGVLMKRDRTGDGAFAYTLGVGLAWTRLYFGAAFRDSTPFDLVLVRHSGSAQRLILHIGWQLGR